MTYPQQPPAPGYYQQLQQQPGYGPPQQQPGYGPPMGYGPPQQPSGYGPPQPQPAYGYSQQPGYVPPQQQPAYGQPPAGYAQSTLTTMPQTHMIDDAAAAAAMASGGGGGGGGGGLRPSMLKVPGPAGQTKWDASVPQNYEGKLRVRLLPPWQAGKLVWHEIQTYFLRTHSKPKGFPLLYQGPDSLFAQAIHMAMSSPDPRLQSQAQQWGRVRQQYLYNCADLSNPATHYGRDGIMRPFVLAAGPQLQNDITRLTTARGGISKLVHVEQGRDLILSKKKTGPEERNVEWGILDMDPAPFAQQFWPLLQNLWNLESLNTPPTQEEVIVAIRELGLPMPSTGSSFAQVPASYQATPQAPWQQPQQPMQQPAQAAWQQPQQPQMTMMPPVASNPGVNLPPQAQGWGQSMPPPLPAGVGAPMGMPPPPSGYGPPPVMPTPPPVTSQPGAGGPGYPMNPGQPSAGSVPGVPF